MSDQKLVTYYDPGSLAAEQFRKLRTQLLRLRLAQPPRTILVTSATSGEGKTLVAANLAAGIAYEFHAYALLVDCDLRARPWARGLACRTGMPGRLPDRKERNS